MLSTQFMEKLKSIVGPENITLERQDLICYGYDATQMEFLPDAVVHPGTPGEIAAILKLANVEKIPVFPRGAGSGFTGGALPKGGGIVLVVTRLNRILRIDTENLIAEVEPGVVTEQFQLAVEKLGLFYPPDPASLKFSTLGGNVAENAGGPRCVKYGVTRDFVMGLEVVLASGDIIRTGGETYKGVVGYDLTRLLCGSEGTLGVITKIIFKLLPLPEARKTMLTIFDSIDGAAKAVSTIIGNRIIPTTLEFMDYATLQCVEKRFNLGIPASGRAVLLIEVDGDRELIEKQADRIRELIQPLGLVECKVAKDAAEAEALWKVRRLVSPSLTGHKPGQVQRRHRGAPEQGAGCHPEDRNNPAEVRHSHCQLRSCRRRQHSCQHHDRQGDSGDGGEGTPRHSRGVSGGARSERHHVGRAWRWSGQAALYSAGTFTGADCHDAGGKKSP